MKMVNAEETMIEQVMDVLVDAERTCTAVGPVSELAPGGLTLEMAHRICEGNLQRRLDQGERVVGMKVGLTNLAVRDNMGLPDSTDGYLLDSMALPSGGTLQVAEFVAPKIETEICFRLGKPLRGTDTTVEATLGVAHFGFHSQRRRQ